jgi:hypothetical protein
MNASAIYKNLFQNLLLSVCSLLILFLAAELFFRYLAYKEDKQIFSEWLSSQQNYINGYPYNRQDVKLGSIVKASNNERIIYDLIPNIDVYFYGGRVIISKEGFRDKNYPTEKAHNTIRIIGLGDSVMFGQGVNNNQNYLDVLEEHLNAKYPERQWEVINTAVNGYNTTMEVETLKFKGLKYRPDIVLIHFGGNDLNLPNFIRIKREYFSIKQSFLYQFIWDRLNNISHKRMPIIDTPNTLLYPDDFEDYLKTIPPHLKYMVGWDAFQSALAELKRISIQEGFEVYILIGYYSGNLYRKALDISQAIDLNIIDTKRDFEEYLLMNDPTSLKASEHDVHPSVIAHRLIANRILSDLSKKSKFFK